jgi:hypothetical protein
VSALLGAAARLARAVVPAAVAIVVCASAAASATGPHRASAPQAKAAATHFGENLVRNPGGEEGVGASDELHIVKPSHWQTEGGFTVVQYGGPEFFPSQGSQPDQLPPSLGKNFFAGGPGGGDISAASQRVDFAWAAHDVDRGDTRFGLSAWLGGWYVQEDAARVLVTFYDDHDRSLCGKPKDVCAALPIVGRRERGGRTTLIPESCSSVIPKRARSAEVRIEAYRFSGDYNDGYADEVSFVVRPQPPVRPATTPAPCTAAAYDMHGKDRTTAALDSRSTSCASLNASLLGLFLAFLVGTAFLIAAGWRGPLAERDTLRRGLAALVAVAVFAATSFGVPGLVLKFQFGDLGCLNQPWVLPSLTFGVVLAAIAVMIVALYLMRKRRGQALPRLKRIWVLADVGILTMLLAFVWMAEYPPTAADLNALDASLLICAVVMVYALLAFGQTVTSHIPRMIRVGLFLLFLAPAYQPLEASWKFAAIQRDRLAFEHEHTLLKTTSPNLEYDNIVFQAPTSLDYSQSARVLFSAHRTTPYKGDGCLAPRLVAPGFDVDGVLDEPARLDRELVTWQWIVTPKRSGRQYIFVTVLSSPKCTPFGAPAPAAGDAKKPVTGEPQRGQSGLDPVFTAEDSTWISRQFFALENLTAVSSSLTAIVGILTVVFGLFGLRKPGSGASQSAPEPPQTR